MSEPLAATAEHAIGIFQRLVRDKATIVARGKVRRGSQVVAYGKARLVACSCSRSSLEVEVGREVVALAAGEMARDDGSGQAARTRCPSKVFANLTIHPCTVVRVQRTVRHLARDGVPEVNQFPLAVADPARAKTHDELVVRLHR